MNVCCVVETESSVHYLEELSYRKDPGSNPGLVLVALGHVYLRTRRSSPVCATHQSSLLIFVSIFLLAAKAGFCACTIIPLWVGCGKPWSPSQNTTLQWACILLNSWLILATLRDSEVESRHDSAWDPNMALRAPRYVISVTLTSYTFVSHLAARFFNHQQTYDET